MSLSAFSLPGSSHYWLKNAHVPIALLSQPSPSLIQSPTREGLVSLNVEIYDGQIRQIQPSSTEAPEDIPSIDLCRGIVFPCFIDIHTHLDKGHIWQRSPNVSGTFNDALETVRKDCEQRWSAEDVYRRMEFGLQCSYAHGTRAIRTHIDAMGEQAEISLSVFKALKAEWADRLTLQAVSLVPIEYFQTVEGEKLADRVAEVGGVLGGLVVMQAGLADQLDRVFELATERGLSLDFHVDESGDPEDIGLRYVAEAALRQKFSEPIVCGHCCSLAVQPVAEALQTIERVKQANIGVVSLPMCNLYLQDRNQSASQRLTDRSFAAASFPTQTPIWRGVTLVHELKHTGVAVAFSSDNCRDPFYGYGDHDVLEVLTQATRIVQLDAPYGDWCRSVTMTPADLMGLSQMGRIGVGLSADLIVFKARYYSELFSRPQSDRLVIRNGAAIDTSLPDYAKLDDLLVDGAAQ